MHGSFGMAGETAGATLCDLGADGTPDRRRSVPVKVRLINEPVLAVDDHLAGGVDAVRGRSVTEERLRFIARLLEGEGMSEVCREFGISRKSRAARVGMFPVPVAGR